MLRAGLIRQAAAGIYNWLPLGYRVLENIERIVEEEQDRSGAIQILMPTLQQAELWRESGRYDAYGKEMLRITDRHDRDLLYGPTNEEQVTDIFRSFVRSYKDLPLNLYHIQWKFRDEIRPRFGVMRGREFLMKDAYSFDADRAGAVKAYNRMFVAYLRTFARLGLKSVPMRAHSGPIGGDMSHEFIILADTGESAGLVPQGSRRDGGPGRGRRFQRRSRTHHQDAHLALRRDRRAARSGRVRSPGARRQAPLRARHRSRTHLLFRHEILGPAQGGSRRPRRPDTARRDGLLRHRRVAPCCRHHRSLS